MKETAKIMVHVNHGFHRAFKARCAQEGRTMSEMIRFLIATYLEDNPPGQITDRAWTIYLAREEKLAQIEGEARVGKEKKESFKYL